MRNSDCKMQGRRNFRLAALAGLAIVAGLGQCGALLAQWQPERNVEIVVPASAGGGLDQFARALQSAAREMRLVPTTMSVVNKAGGGGLIALNYLNQHAADGQYLMVHTPTLLTNHILGKGSMNHRDVTPLAELYSEYVVVMVRADSPLKNAKDLVAALRKNAGSLSIGIATSVGNHNHTGIALPLRAAGVDVRSLKIVIFNSVGDSTAALLGGHIDVVPTPPANVLSLATAGTVRGIAVSAPQRIPEPYAEVPTWKELGMNVVFTTTRNVAGPKGLAHDRVLFWDGVLEQIANAPDWRESLRKRLLNNTFKKSAEVRKHLEEQYGELKEVLTELGLVKAN